MQTCAAAAAAIVAHLYLIFIFNLHIVDKHFLPCSLASSSKPPLIIARILKRNGISQFRRIGKTFLFFDSGGGDDDDYYLRRTTSYNRNGTITMAGARARHTKESTEPENPQKKKSEKIRTIYTSMWSCDRIRILYEI